MCVCEQLHRRRECACNQDVNDFLWKVRTSANVWPPPIFSWLLMSLNRLNWVSAKVFWLPTACTFGKRFFLVPFAATSSNSECLLWLCKCRAISCCCAALQTVTNPHLWKSNQESGNKAVLSLFAPGQSSYLHVYQTACAGSAESNIKKQ